MIKALVELCSAGLYACMTYAYIAFPEIFDGAMLFVVVLTVDMIVGVSKSYVLDAEDPNRFSKRKMIIGFVSKLCFYIVVMATIALSTYIYGNDTTFNKTLMGIFLHMFMGVIHNIVQIAKGERIPEWNAIAIAFEGLYGGFKKIVEKSVKLLQK